MVQTLVSPYAHRMRVSTEQKFHAGALIALVALLVSCVGSPTSPAGVALDVAQEPSAPALQGRTGERGIDGPRGPGGLPGVAGPRGPAGATGERGPAGLATGNVIAFQLRPLFTCEPDGGDGWNCSTGNGLSITNLLDPPALVTLDLPAGNWLVQISMWVDLSESDDGPSPMRCYVQDDRYPLIDDGDNPEDALNWQSNFVGVLDLIYEDLVSPPPSLSASYSGLVTLDAVGSLSLFCGPLPGPGFETDPDEAEVQAKIVYLDFLAVEVPSVVRQ